MNIVIQHSCNLPYSSYIYLWLCFPTCHRHRAKLNPSSKPFRAKENAWTIVISFDEFFSEELEVANKIACHQHVKLAYGATAGQILSQLPFLGGASKWCFVRRNLCSFKTCTYLGSCMSSGREVIVGIIAILFWTLPVWDKLHHHGLDQTEKQENVSY